MPEQDERKKDKEACLRDIQYVTENLNVFDVAVQMDEVNEENETKSKG